MVSIFSKSVETISSSSPHFVFTIIIWNNIEVTIYNNYPVPITHICCWRVRCIWQSWLRTWPKSEVWNTPRQGSLLTFVSVNIGCFILLSSHSNAGRVPFSPKVPSSLAEKNKLFQTRCQRTPCVSDIHARLCATRLTTAVGDIGTGIGIGTRS